VETNPIHRQIIATLRMRVAQALRADEDKLPCMSAGELLNILFLLVGQWGSVGDYGASVKTLFLLLGDLLWAKPETQPQTENAKPVVN
jgi:hypothetical protein